MNNILSSVEKCKRCDLWRTKKNVVVGEGCLDTDILFIGEAPGRNEDLKGRPFVGMAGKILDELLESIGYLRQEVYICNILKCRPPKNRNPLKTEIEQCSKFLDKQIELIDPKIIVTLGNFSTSFIFKKFALKYEKISNFHGKNFQIEQKNKDISIIPIYHPAAVIYNQKLKKIIFEDFKEIKKVLYKYK